MQKRASSASSDWQFEQRRLSGVPQFEQNRADGGFSVWQRGQFIERHSCTTWISRRLLFLQVRIRAAV
jgi:hypothetical protein